MNPIESAVPFFFLIYLLLLLIFVCVLIIMKLANRLDRERVLNKVQLDELKRFKLAVSNVSDHIVITNKEGMIIYANRAVESVTGYSIEEAIGTKAGQLWGNQMPKEYYKQMWKTISKDKKVFSGECKNRRKDGQLYDANVSISPVLDESGLISFYVGVERDITLEKERDQAKSDFISIASHQLRTPLTVIKGYVSMILENDFGELPDKIREQVLKVYESNERLIGLVTDLLNVSRIESGKMTFEMQTANMETLVTSVVAEMKNLADAKKLELIYRAPSEPLPMVTMDPDKFRQVLGNLIENSIKYTNSGHTEIILEQVNDDLRFCVQDTGVGISQTAMPNIFEKYSRSKQANTKTINGTGLGLYVCKMIVQAHQGKIWAESAGINKGSRFCVTIPITHNA